MCEVAKNDAILNSGNWIFLLQYARKFHFGFLS
jgi:hypothetical protein